MAASRLIFSLLALGLLAACKPPFNPLTIHPFGTMPAGHPDAGRPVALYTLAHRNGLRVSVTNYGAAIIGIEMPDRDGRVADITLGYDRFEDYLGRNPYYGSTIGRYAGRISNARFTLEGATSVLSANAGPHTLHGGAIGFDKRYWTAEPLKSRDGSAPGVRFTFVSPSGDQGFPGTLRATVTYTLTESELIVRYTATTDEPTVINLTNHSYFNLTGSHTDAGRQHLVLHADQYLEQNRDWCPTGRILPVEDTLMDFRRAVRIDERVFTPRTNPRWYDHTYVVSGVADPQTGLRRAAELLDPVSGRYMAISTDQPTIYFYPGNSLGDFPPGKDDVVYPAFSGICLEPQAWPDAPNRPEFPPAALYPSNEYHSTIVYTFGIRDAL